MQQRFYRLAGLLFRVRSETLDYDQGILAEFVASEGPCDVDCTSTVVERLSEPEGELCFHDSANQVFQTAEGMLR